MWKIQKHSWTFCLKQKRSHQEVLCSNFHWNVTETASICGDQWIGHLCVHQLCHLSNFKKIFLHKISWHMWYILVQSAATSAGYGCEELLGDYLRTVISCNFFTIFSFDSDVCFCGATCQISSPQGCILCFILQMQIKLLYISCNDTSK